MAKKPSFPPVGPKPEPSPQPPPKARKEVRLLIEPNVGMFRMRAFARTLLSLPPEKIESLDQMASSFKGANDESKERIVEKAVELLFGGE